MDPREMDPYSMLPGLQRPPPPQPIVIAPDTQQATLDEHGTIVHPG